MPQALHIIRHKEARAISLQMYVVLATGVALWMIFGLWNWPLILANGLTLVLALLIISMNLRYG